MNGELMLQFCTQRGLSIINAFFQQPDKNFYTWRHPRSKHSHLLDYVVTRKTCMHEILSTKALRGAECSTDHYLVRSQIRMQLIFPRRKEPQKTPSRKLNTEKLHNEEHQQALAAAITAALESGDNMDGELREVERMWTHMKETVLSAADGALGRPLRKTPDWFLENEERIQPLLNEKTRIYNRHLHENSAMTKIALREIKAKLQREIRAMKDKWWSEKAEELQEKESKS